MRNDGLLFPIEAIDGRLLLPKGTKLDDIVFDEVVAMREKPFEKRPMLTFSTIFKDMEECISSSKQYQFIFSDDTRREQVLSLMKSVDLALPILESLLFFKESDLYTYRHLLMVFALSTVLSLELFSDKKGLLQEATASPTHDIGKICIPLGILQKEKALTSGEKEILSQHTLAGYILLSYYFGERGNLSTRVARDHHERKNGTGYPAGKVLSDPAIEIIVGCDIYDALISPRPYRKSTYDNRTALEELTMLARQGQLSWSVVQALVACNRRVKTSIDECVVSLERRGKGPSDSVYGKISTDEVFGT